MIEFTIPLKGDSYDLKRFLTLAVIHSDKWMWINRGELKIYKGKDFLGTIYLDRNFPINGRLVGHKLFASLFPLKELQKVISCH